MNKTLTWVVVAVIVLIAIGAFYATRNRTATTTAPTTNTPAATDNSSATDSTASTQSTTASVGYDGKSFTPSLLTVTPGTTVTFTNNSSSPMWVASDPHPSHTDLPGFDSKKSVGRGQSYTFTFVKSGSWGYHNHLNESQTGRVVVQ